MDPDLSGSVWICRIRLWFALKIVIQKLKKERKNYKKIVEFTVGRTRIWIVVSKILGAGSEFFIFGSATLVICAGFHTPNQSFQYALQCVLCVCVNSVWRVQFRQSAGCPPIPPALLEKYCKLRSLCIWSGWRLFPNETYLYCNLKSVLRCRSRSNGGGSGST